MPDDKETEKSEESKASEEDLEGDVLPENNDYSYLKQLDIEPDLDRYFERNISSKEEIEEMKKKMEEDLDKVKELMTQLHEYFSEKVDQIGINNREFEITIPIEYEGLKFVTVLSLHPAWIFIKAKVMNLSEVSDKTKFKLYESILIANFELNAVFYSIDPEGSGIWIENDIPTKELSIENFDVNFNAIIFGIRFFVDNIALPLNQEVKGTFDASSMYT
ncbi:MAG: hypothetical protein ACFFCS_24720 [Candidatus Hodarchaeota archaeon]